MRRWLVTGETPKFLQDEGNENHGQCASFCRPARNLVAAPADEALRPDIVAYLVRSLNPLLQETSHGPEVWLLAEPCCLANMPVIRLTAYLSHVLLVACL